jgi:putative membrane protein
MHGFNGMHWGMGIGWFVFAAILFVSVWLLARFVYTGTRTNEKEKTVLNILNERYARGEISKEEYLNIKKDISR